MTRRRRYTPSPLTRAAHLVLDAIEISRDFAVGIGSIIEWGARRVVALVRPPPPAAVRRPPSAAVPSSAVARTPPADDLFVAGLRRLGFRKAEIDMAHTAVIEAGATDAPLEARLSIALTRLAPARAERR